MVKNKRRSSRREAPVATPAVDPFGGAIPLGRAGGAKRAVFGFRPPGAGAGEGAQPGELLLEDGEGHSMIFAPTGAGKGVSYAIPALLAFQGSAIVLDIKGELSAVSARARRQMGQSVVILDPFDITGQSNGGFNPLDLVDAQAEDAVDDCMSLAAAIANERGLKDPFWDERATQLITQTILYVCAERPPQQRHLGEVWRILNQGSSALEREFAAMSRSAVTQVREGAAICSTADPRVFGSIVSCAQRYVDTFRSPKTRPSFAATGFSTADLIQGRPVTIYLAMPVDRIGSHAALLRVWLSALFMLVRRRRRRPERPTLFLIDEAAQIGRLEFLVGATTLMRGYGVKTMTFWQDAQQLESTYPAEWRTLFNNTALHLCFGAMTPMAGHATATLFDAAPSKLTGLAAGEALMMRTGEETQVIRRLDYRQEPELLARADPNPFYAAAPPVDLEPRPPAVARRVLGPKPRIRPRLRPVRRIAPAALLERIDPRFLVPWPARL